MQNFYTETGNFTGNTITITGEEHHHATLSCRVKIGELIGVADGCGKRVEARIKTIDSRTITAVIERDVSGIGEPLIEITLALSLIKPSRFETAVEKCTELGARYFIPLIAQRCAYKPGLFKLDRFKKIALEAAKQSGRSWIPEIISPIGVKAKFTAVESAVLVGVRSAAVSLESVLECIPKGRALTLVIGPEGDFTDEEQNFLLTSGSLPFSLGGLTLRSETAAITATALAVNAVGRFE